MPGWWPRLQVMSWFVYCTLYFRVKYTQCTQSPHPTLSLTASDSSSAHHNITQYLHSIYTASKQYLLRGPHLGMVLVQFKDQNPAKFARQEVVRTSLGRLLTSPSYSHILVPVFQRPYCWPRNQLQPWYVNRRSRHASFVSQC